MSLLDKLFGGDKKAEKTAKDLLNGLFGAAQQKPANSAEPQPSWQQDVRPSQTSSWEESPSGFSWGENMPDEENQFNYNGTYTEYFEHIFREEFPGYSYEKSFVGDYRNRVIYRFSGSALVVELMNESCSSKKIRKECEKAGTPYLRFYYDHDGWWNTREYVVTRIRKVLG